MIFFFSSKSCFNFSSNESSCPSKEDRVTGLLDGLGARRAGEGRLVRHEGAGDRPEATFVALAGDDVVAYAKLSLSLARPTVAMHDMTGVLRAWRGRGIARALKAAEIAWAMENGYERLETQNEERNEPIRRLNERYGYVVEPGSVTVRGPIA